MKTLFIGERFPLLGSSLTRRLLLPLPRLAGVSPAAFDHFTRRMYLLPHSDRWRSKQARLAAESLWRGGMVSYQPVVLLGARVRDAFDAAAPQLGLRETEWGGLCKLGYQLVVPLPYPSERNRAWNDKAFQERAGRLLHELVTSPATVWGREMGPVRLVPREGK